MREGGKKMERDGQGEKENRREEDGAEEEEKWEGRRGANAESREAVGKWIIRKAQLKDNLYFINAAKLHYCSHTQSYCPHSRLRPGGGGGNGGKRKATETEGGKVEIKRDCRGDEEKKSDIK